MKDVIQELEWLKGRCGEDGYYNRAEIVQYAINEIERLRAAAAGASAGAELDRLLADALREAADEIEAWGAYAGSYFQDKHDLEGTVQRFRDLAASAGAGARADEIPSEEKPTYFRDLSIFGN